MVNGNKDAKGKGFQKGVCANPGGRPKGLAALVRAKTKDGKELVDLHLQIMRDELTVTVFDNEGNAHERGASFKDRLAAASWLADRGFGKVSDTISIQNPDGSNLLSPVLLEAAAALAKSYNKA